MSKIKISGNASGTGVVTLTAPNTNTDRTITLPDGDITLGVGIDDNATSTAITIDSSENVGIGVVPESWHSSYKALQLYSTSTALQASTRQIGLSCGTKKNTAGNWQFQGSGDKAGLYQIDDSTATHKFYVSNGTGSPGDTISWTTGFEVLNDGKARAKNGLLFGTDTAAANALDDYETGTWTPTDQSGAGLTFTKIDPTYTKIGNIVHLSAFISFPTTSDTSLIKIGGVPFNISYVATSKLFTNNGNNYSAYGDNAYIFPRTNTNGTPTNASMSGQFFHFTFTYRT